MLRICKICGEEKFIYEFELTNNSQYRRRVCKECIKIKNRKPKKEVDPNVSEEILKRRLRQKKYYRKKTNKLKEVEVNWVDDLYSYIVSKNLFSTEDLKIIYKFIKFIDVMSTK